MTQLTSLRLAPIRKLVEARRYSDALLELQRIGTPSSDTAEFGEFCLLRAESSLATGDYAVREWIDKAMEFYRFGANTECFARAKYLLGWMYSLTGQHSQAEQVLLESYVHYLRCNATTDAAQALNRMSYGAFQTGKTETAIASLRECLSLVAESADGLYQVRIAHNLAYVLWASGSLGEASCLYSNHRVSETQSEDKTRLNYYYMSPLPLALRGDLRAAKATIAKCAPYLDTYPREKAIYLENLGLIHILAGEYPQARKALMEGLELSLKVAPESALVSQTKRLLADLHIALQKYDLARQYAEQALAVAEKIGQKVEIAACWRVFAQLATHESRSDEARNWYRKAIDLFALISSRYELAVTRYLAATSDLLEPGERSALLYLAKEYFESEEVAPYIEKVNAELRRMPLIEPAAALTETNGRGALVVAVSPIMMKQVDFARHIAPSSMSVLLTGETGVGKDRIARYIHDHSGRSGEFVVLNSAALPAELIEAELFGVLRGAFTGAVDRQGLFAQADSGTLYLNEIADASPQFQAKLLEVLDSRQIRPLGGTAWRKVDVRVIAATNHKLSQRISEGLFRLDLYHRLNQIGIDLPPLRDRREDIPALVEHFLITLGFEVNGNAPDLARLCELLSHEDWPGNVRELEGRVKRLWTLSDGDLDQMAHLALTQADLTDQDRLTRVLHEVGWNRSRAAGILGVTEGAVRKQIKKYGLIEP